MKPQTISYCVTRVKLLDPIRACKSVIGRTSLFYFSGWINERSKWLLTFFFTKVLVIFIYLHQLINIHFLLNLLQVFHAARWSSFRSSVAHFPLLLLTLVAQSALLASRRWRILSISYSLHHFRCHFWHFFGFKLFCIFFIVFVSIYRFGLQIILLRFWLFSDFERWIYVRFDVCNYCFMGFWPLRRFNRHRWIAASGLNSTSAIIRIWTSFVAQFWKVAMLAMVISFVSFLLFGGYPPLINFVLQRQCRSCQIFASVILIWNGRVVINRRLMRMGQIHHGTFTKREHAALSCLHIWRVELLALIGNLNDLLTLPQINIWNPITANLCWHLAVVQLKISLLLVRQLNALFA